MKSMKKLVLAASMAFVFAISGSAQAGTTMYDVLDDGDVSYSSQIEAAEDFAAAAGISSKKAVANLVGSSRGQLLRFMSTEGDAAGAGFASSDSNTSAFLNNAYAGLESGSSAAARDLTILNGTYATAGANVGLRTVQSIGGSGGVIQARQAALMAERDSVSRFGDNSALASIRMNENTANRIWATPFYSYHDMDDKDGYAGYDYKAWGASVGYDRAVGNFAFGAAFTYSRGEYEENNLRDDNTIDNYGFSLYGQYYSCNGFFATLAGGFNYGDNEWKAYSTLQNQWVKADNHTNSWWLGGNVGYDFQVSSSFTLTPSIGLFWSEARNSAYSTSGAVVQNFSKIKAKSLLMPIDLTATWRHEIDNCSSISFKVSGGYAYNFKRDRAEGSFTYNGYENTPIFVQGIKPGRHSYNVGAGVTYQIRNVDVGVDYRYDGASKYDAHRVAATVGLSF